MSKNRLTNGKRVGMLFYMATRPRSFNELLSFTKTDASTLQKLISFGIKREVITVSDGKYSACSNAHDAARKAFFNYYIVDSNQNRHSNEHNPVVAEKKKVLSPCKQTVIRNKRCTVKKKEFKKAISIDHVRYSSNLDAIDEAIAQDYSRNVEFGHGKKKQWTDATALQYQKEKEELLKNRKKFDSTDRFALK